MICPNCQAKFNGFKMGKNRTDHLIQCGSCHQILIPTQISFNTLQKNKGIGLSIAGLIYIIGAFLGNKLLMDTKDLYFYLLLVLLAIVTFKLYLIFYKNRYATLITFEPYKTTSKSL